MSLQEKLRKLLEEFNPHFDIPSGYAIPVVVFKQMEDLEKKWWEIRGKIEEIRQINPLWEKLWNRVRVEGNGKP